MRGCASGETFDTRRAREVPPPTRRKRSVDDTGRQHDGTLGSHSELLRTTTTVWNHLVQLGYSV